jgi:hypothetical protein
MRTPRPRTLLAAALTAAALVAGPAGIAEAATWSHTDATGDVVDLQFPDRDSAPVETPAPDRAVGDITKVRASHTARRVVLRIAMRQSLAPDGWAIVGTVRTERRTYAVRFVRDSRTRAYWVSKNPDSTDYTVPCRGLSKKIDSGAGTVQFSVPRSCLGNPRWVRVNMSVYDYDGPLRTYVDDGLDNGGWERVPLSPRIRRG